MSDYLNKLLKKATEAFEKLSPEEQARHREEQRRSFVRGEIGMGSDADEAAYRAAHAAGDQEAMKRLDAEAAERVRKLDAMQPIDEDYDARVDSLRRKLVAALDWMWNYGTAARLWVRQNNPEYALVREGATKKPPETLDSLVDELWKYCRYLHRFYNIKENARDTTVSHRGRAEMRWSKSDIPAEIRSAFGAFDYSFCAIDLSGRTVTYYVYNDNGRGDSYAHRAISTELDLEVAKKFAQHLRTLALGEMLREEEVARKKQELEEKRRQNEVRLDAMLSTMKE